MIPRRQTPALRESPRKRAVRTGRLALGIAVGLVMGPSGVGAGKPGFDGSAEGADLIGTTAPTWRGLQWLQGGPLSLEQLRGKVVLIRFWTAGCPLCTHTA